MKVHVFDTYVKAGDGHTMHFDVITDSNDSQKAVEYAKKWLASIGQKDAKVTTEECRFCHSETVPDEIEVEIMTSGFYIQKMEGCP
jgi:hypothetical protein